MKLIKFFVINLCFFNVLSYIDIVELQNTYNCVKDTKNAMLSPLVGAISFYSEWIENFYRFGNMPLPVLPKGKRDPDSAVYTLVRKIFYYNRDTRDFNITKSTAEYQALPQVLATLGLVSNLIEWYINFRDNHPAVKAAEAVQKEEAASAAESADTRKKYKKRKKVQPLSRKAVDAYNRERKNAFKEELEKKILNSDENLRKYTEFLQGQAKKEETITIEDAKSNLTKVIEKSEKGLINSIINSFEELEGENAILPSFVLEQILATYWFMAQDNKDSISDYIKILRGEAGECPLPLENSYDKENLTVIKNAIDEDDKKYLWTHPELLAFYLVQELKIGLNPPFVRQGKYRFGVKAGISDCVESTVHNFFDFILYDQKTNTYDFGLLPEKVRETLNSKLVDFYNNFPLNVTVSHKAGQQWFNLISSLCEQKCKVQRGCDTNKISCTSESLEHLCEANGDEKNVVNIINRLLGTSAENFIGFASLLSTPERDFEIEKKDRGHFKLSIGERTASFSFDFGHAEVTFKSPTFNAAKIFGIISEESKKSDFYLLLETLNPSLDRSDMSGSWRRDYYLFAGQSLDIPKVLGQVLNLMMGFYDKGTGERFIDSLLKQDGIDINEKDGNDRTVLDYLRRGYLRLYLDEQRKKIEELIQQRDFEGLIKFFNVNVGDNNERTLLMVAAEDGNKEKFFDFLKQGADPDAEDSNERTVLMYAARGGNRDIIDVLIKEEELDVDAQDVDGKTVLMYAAESGNPEIVCELLNRGADPNPKDRDGKTGLMYAIEDGDIEIIRALLNQGADINAKEELYGKTALFYAVVRKNNQIVRELLNHGADPNLNDKYGKTVLIYGVEDGDAEIVCELLNQGADPNLSDRDVKTALFYAVGCKNNQIVRELLNHGADPNLSDKHGKTVLIYALEGGNTEIIRELLNHGADPNAKDASKKTALMYAVEGGDIDIIRELLDRGADANVESRAGMTPLIYAIERRDVQLVSELLMRIKANFKGRSPLVEAIILNDDEMVKYLIAQRVPFNLVDDEGRAPLIEAINKGNNSIAKDLIELGADVNITDRNGSSPLSIAVARKDADMVRYLMRRGALHDDTVVGDALRFAADIGDIPLIEELMSKVRELIESGSESLERISPVVVQFVLRKKDEELLKRLINRGVKLERYLIDTIKNGDREQIKMLLDNGVNLNQESDWKPALLFAIERGNPEIVHDLLEHGANSNAKDASKKTALMYAVEGGDIDIISELLDRGADANVESRAGMTPLIYAIERRDVQLVSELLKHGADPDIVTRQGDSALSYAIKSQNFELISEILKRIKAHFKGKSPVVEAIIQNDDEMVKYLIAQRVPFDLVDDVGRAPLIEAIKIGNNSIAEYLIGLGADVNITDRNGSSPLSIAVAHKDADMVRYLMRHGALPDDTVGSEALRFAVNSEDIPLIEELMSKGVSPNISYSRGMYIGSLLGYLVREDEKELAEILIENGADVNKRFGREPFPLGSAVINENKELVELLINAGADVSIKPDGWPLHSKNQEIQNMLERARPENLSSDDLLRFIKDGNERRAITLVNQGIDSYVSDEEGRTILMWALAQKMFDLVKVLLPLTLKKDEELLERGERGEVNRAGLLARDSFGVNVLMYAAESGDLDLVNNLIDLGLDVYQKDRSGANVLMYAAKSGNPDLIDFLVEKGLKLDATDFSGANLLKYAAQSGDINLVKYLIDKGLDVNTKDRDGRTILMYAVKSDNVDLVKFLIDKGLTIDVRDRYEQTPLAYAAYDGAQKVAKYLLDNGNDIEHRNYRGETPLMLAALTDQNDMVKFLVDNGADVNVYDNDGNSPLSLAMYYRNPELVDYLLTKVNEEQKGQAYQMYEEVRERAEDAKRMGDKYLQGAPFESLEASDAPLVEPLAA